MRCTARKNILILATVGFTAMVTGLSLHVHLLAHDHGKTHDSAKCSVCITLHAAAGKFTAERQLDIAGLSRFQGDTDLPPDVHMSAFSRQPFAPRAPPV